jgi:hypothetical protein
VKFANPFWSYPSVRIRFDDDPKKTMIVGSIKEIEVPEGVTTAVVEPISGGRSDSPAISEAAIWTPETGVMSMAGYQEQVTLMEQRKKLREEKDAAAARKAKEARERGNQKKAVSEKPKKVVKDEIDKPIDMGKKLEL